MGIVDEEFVRWVQMGVRPALLCCTSWVAFWFFRWARDGSLTKLASQGGDAEYTASVMQTSSFAPASYLLMSAILACLFPSSVTPLTIRCWIAVTHVRMMINVALPMSVLQFVKFSQRAAIFRMFLCLHCPQWRFVTALNVASSVVTVCSAVSAAQDQGAMGELLQIEALNLAVVLSMYFNTRKILLGQVRSTLAAKSSRHMEVSFETLLNGMCDAVVHLHGNLTLKKPAEKMDALLLRSLAGGHTRVGKDFLDLLYDPADRERFRNFVQPQAPAEGLPGSMHTTLQAAYQVPVPVQLFHAKCLDAVDEPFHIVGIRERDGSLGGSFAHGSSPATTLCHRHLPAQELRQGGLSPASTPRSTVSVPVALSRRTPSQESISERSALSSSHPPLPLAPEDLYRPGEISVWTKVFSSGLSMCQCTPEFSAQLGGPSLKASASLASWAPKKERQDLVDNIQDAVNKLANTGMPQVRLAKVTLAPPSATVYNVEADLTVTLADEEGLADDTAEELEADLQAKVTCHNLRYKPKPKSRPRARERARDGRGAASLSL